MPVQEVARTWFGRLRVILVCGTGDFASRLEEDSLRLIYARSLREVRDHVETGLIDAALVEETPWPNGDRAAVARELRSLGIGVVFAVQTKTVAEQCLRDRLTVFLSAPNFRRNLIDALWVACCETEVVRATLVEIFRASTGTPATPRMRFVENNGHIEPSESTVAYVFGDLPTEREQKAHAAEGTDTTPSLVAPPIPFIESNSWSDASRTVTEAPPQSLLDSLRAHLDLGEQKIEQRSTVEKDRPASRYTMKGRHAIILLLSFVTLSVAIWRLVS